MGGASCIMLSKLALIETCVVGLMQILVGVSLIIAGRQIGKLGGSRKLMIVCHVFGVLCFVLLGTWVIQWTQIFLSLGPNARISWQ